MFRLLSLALLFVLPALAADAPKDHPLIAKLKELKVKGSFTLLVTLKIKSGETKAFFELAKPCVDATRKEKGCIAYDPQTSLTDPTKVVFYERWKSIEALAEHLNAEHTKTLLAGIGKLLDGEPVMEFYQMPEDR
ncbi:MAG: antibiotic biosynthesis monooxygenase [Planctomycetia bacterium]|nr:antibiotic biosynthesis monooxygenase [Planctomycetia bacterium]